MQRSSTTSSTLLERLRNARDDEAWERFTVFYQPLIYQYARGCRCTEEMAWDIVQETLVDLLSIMSDFKYDPDKGRFRDFLYRVVRNRVLRAFRREKRYVNAEDIETYRKLAQAAAIPASEPAVDWNRHWQRQLLRVGLKTLQERVQQRTYEAFHAYVIQERPVEDVCAEYGLNANALYQIRHRSTDMLRRIIKELEDDMEGVNG